MRFYQDDCERLVRVNWFFVERNDFVPITPFVSSYYDEAPAGDGNPVGEMIDGRTPRKGTIPPGTGISPLFKGTADQWAGNIDVADRVRLGSTCSSASTNCYMESISTVTSCPSGVYFSTVKAPVLKIGENTVPMTLVTMPFTTAVEWNYDPSTWSYQPQAPGMAVGWAALFDPITLWPNLYGWAQGVPTPTYFVGVTGPLTPFSGVAACTVYTMQMSGNLTFFSNGFINSFSVYVTNQIANPALFYMDADDLNFNPIVVPCSIQF